MVKEIFECDKCGSRVKKDESYCSNCGTELCWGDQQEDRPNISEFEDELGSHAKKPSSNKVMRLKSIPKPVDVLIRHFIRIGRLFIVVMAIFMLSAMSSNGFSFGILILILLLVVQAAHNVMVNSYLSYKAMTVPEKLNHFKSIATVNIIINSLWSFLLFWVVMDVISYRIDIYSAMKLWVAFIILIPSIGMIVIDYLIIKETKRITSL